MQIGENLASSVKSKTCWYFFAFQVTIDSLWASNNSSFHVFSPSGNRRNSIKIQKGTTTKWEHLYLKFSASKQAFVFESSPPIMTIPSKSSFLAVSSACLNWNIIKLSNEELYIITLSDKIAIYQDRNHSIIQFRGTQKRNFPVQGFQSYLGHCRSYQIHPGKIHICYQ